MRTCPNGRGFAVEGLKGPSVRSESQSRRQVLAVRCQLVPIGDLVAMQLELDRGLLRIVEIVVF